MNNPIDFADYVKVIADVVVDELKAGISLMVSYVVKVPGNQIIKNGNLMPFRKQSIG